MHYLWLDLETTGLDERTCSILEVAFTITDQQGQTVSLPNWVEGTFYSAIVRPQTLDLAAMDKHVIEMHCASGLFKQVALASPRVCGHHVVQAEIVRILDDLKLDAKTLTLAGNSIHFDWRFLRQHMPDVIARIHYRLLDVSAVALFAEGLGIPRPEKVVAHRAEDDVRASLEMFRYYQKHLVVGQNARQALGL